MRVLKYFLMLRLFQAKRRMLKKFNKYFQSRQILLIYFSRRNLIFDVKFVLTEFTYLVFRVHFFRLSRSKIIVRFKEVKLFALKILLQITIYEKYIYKWYQFIKILYIIIYL